MDQIKSQVRNSFTKLRQALDLREKLLLRQLDVLDFQKIDTNKLIQLKFLTDEEAQVLELLRNYGVYQNIDCYLPYLENENENDQNEMLYEKSFDPNSFDNKKLETSIINLTLKESQNLITKSKDLVTSVGEALKLDSMGKPLKKIPSDLSIKQKNDSKVKTNNETSIKQKTESKTSEKRNEDAATSSKKKTLKNISNLTLNNFGGNIILKNISNLTINTCKQSPSSGEKPEPILCTTSKSCDENFYQCDFYERLITENEALKRSIVHESLSAKVYPDPIDRTCMSPDRDDGTYSINSIHGDTTTTTSSIMEALDGKNDEKIEEITTRTMIADKQLTNHPPIQCWLNNMLLETETEAQNITEFLEISSIM